MAENVGDFENVRVPRLRRDADFTKLPEGRAEGLIIARIDGVTSIDEIAEATGTDRARVVAVVEQLVADEILEWVEVPNWTPHERPEPASRRPRPSSSHTAPKAAPAPPLDPNRVRYEAAELDEEGIELPEERRRQILDTFYRLDELTFYDLLEIEPDADKVAVRRAYFQLSKVFHPDTAYGKKLGAFKPKMESVFKRLTEAYEVLGKERTRAEYDNYIRLRLRTRAAQKILEEGESNAKRAAEEASAEAKRAIAEPSSTPVEPPDDAPATEPTRPLAAISMPVITEKKSTPPPPPEAVGDPELERRMSEEGRDRKRQLMAKKLLAATNRSMPSAVARSKPVVVTTTDSRKQALRGLATTLKQTAAFTGGIDIAQRHIEEATRHEEAGNMVEAANALRLALALAPDRKDLQQHHDRVAQLVAAELAEDYAAQAEYEERNDKWADAALSWARVCEGRPNELKAHLHAARCMFQSNTDLQRARGFAQRAVELGPDHAAAHKTLGLIYHAAGMKLNARRALEDAIKLDPKDEMVDNLLRELSK